MADKQIKAGSQALVTLAAMVVVIAGLKAGEALIVPLLVATCVAASVSPIVHGLCRRGLPTYVSVAIAIVLALGGLVAFGALTAMAASDFTESLPRMERTVVAMKGDVAHWLAQNRMGRLAPMAMNFDAGKLSEGAVSSAVLKVPEALSSFGVVLFVAVFILLEAATFQGKLRRALNWHSDRFLAARTTIAEVQKYLLVKTWISAGVGVLCGAWCAVLGVSNPVLWGVITFALNYIPVFGSLIATIGPILMALLDLGPLPALGVAAGLLAIHNVVGNVVEPKILGRALGLSPLVVMLSIIVWGYILGPVGALLSVPLTNVVKIILANTEDMRWVAVLLGPGEGREEQKYAEARRLSRVSGLPPTQTAEQS